MKSIEIDQKVEDFKKNEKNSQSDIKAFKKILKRSKIPITAGVLLEIFLSFFFIIFMIGQVWQGVSAIAFMMIFVFAILILYGMDLKKHPVGYINHVKSADIDTTDTVENYNKFTSDKTQWHWNLTCEKYCEKYTIKPNNLTDKDTFRISNYAGNHIAFFLTWLIENDFYLCEDAAYTKYVKDVKERKMTGSEFLTNYCDEILSRYEISDKVLDFVDYYYDDFYYNDYRNFVENKLNKNVYGIDFSWEEYNQMKEILNSAYYKYRTKTKQ